MAYAWSGLEHASKAGEVRARTVGARGALVVPTVAFFAAPGVQAAACVGGLGRPERLVPGWLINLGLLPPLVVELAASGRRASKDNLCWGRLSRWRGSGRSLGGCGLCAGRRHQGKGQ